MNELLSRLAKLSPQERSLLRNRLRRSAKARADVDAGRPGDFPLSFAQQRLWLLAQMGPQTALYNNSAAFRFLGDFDVVVFRDCLREIVRRHEILRTRIVYRDGAAVQEVSPALEVAAPLVDLSALPGARGEEEARRRVEAQAREPFDLGAAPLLRVLLLDMGRGGESGEREHVVAITLHHIVSDGWSTDVLIREFRELYEAFAAGRASPLPALELQYGDYAVWQREWLQGEVLERQLAYWREALSGAPATLDLMTDRPRPATQDPRGAVYDFAVSASVTAKLRELGRGCGATLFMTLLGAFDVLLFRHSGQTDLCVGTPVANRRRVELEGLIGFFVNTLVMRVDLSGDPSFVELLRRVRARALGAQANQDLPFERLVEELRPERDMSRGPLFQAMFILQNAPSRALGLAGLRIDAFAMESGTAKFDLTLQASESEDGLLFSLEYATALFDAATIERMARRFQLLLEGIAAAPERRLSELPLLPEDELRRLLVEWNPSAAHAESRCLHELFEAQAARSPDAIAVVFEEARLSYGALNAKANQLAHHLRRRGVVADEVVGLCVERSLELVIGVLGVLKAGGAYLPLDPSYPQARLAYMIEDARPKLILTQEALCERLPEGVETLRLDADWATLAGESEANPAPAATAQNLAYIIYTSGSTGTPKGVGVAHHNVPRLFVATRDAYGFDARDVWTLFHSFAFDFSVWEIWGALLHGGRLVVVPFLVSRAPEAFHALLKREGVTVLNQTPSSFYQLDAADAARGAAEALSLRLVIFGGEALEPLRLVDWFARHGDAAPALVNMYGITETTVHVTLQNLDAAGPEGGVGRPLDDLQTYLLDMRMNPVPIGVAGELYVGGAGLARGYVNRPDLTAERFAPSPFGRAGERLYRTGDLARYRADGTIDYLGRIDHQVKIRGFRIELGEIEATLARAAGVQDAIVVAREDGSSGKRLIAYVTAREATALDVAELRAAAQRGLPDYMVPSAIVVLDKLPLTANGKIDRKALPAPDMGARSADRYVAPRNAREETLCRIWAEVLGLDRVGVEDNFFELGGHSLSVIQLASRTLQVMGAAIPIELIFKDATVASAAAFFDLLFEQETEKSRGDPRSASEFEEFEI
jgi:amino acid adenylation domain-containing protein